MNIRTIVTAAMFVAVTASTVEAQWRRPGRWYQRGRSPYRVRVGVVLTPGGWRPAVSVSPSYYVPNRADIIRARAQATRDYTQAQVNQQVARSKYIENQKKWHAIYQERKRLGEAARQAKIEERQARAKRIQRIQSKQPHQVRRLTTDQLDPNTGKLTWPKILQTAEYAGDRSELDQLFELRMKTGTTSDLTSKIYTKAEAMRTRFRSKVGKIPSKAYIEGRNFLELMAREAHYPVRR